MKGVAQTPPDVAWSDRNVQQAHPSGGQAGRGQGRGGLALGV